MNAKPKILVVDDQKFNLGYLSEILKMNHEIIEAENGVEAIKLAKSKRPPDLILLDILMKDMDGYEVCRILKADTQTRNIPVIFLTAKTTVEDEKRGFELGAVDYITKPFHPGIVTARVSTHLRLKHKTDLLESLVALDGLTEIPNRRRFDEVYGIEYKRSKRIGKPLSIGMIDIDYFKDFNDNYGHALGDDCLKKVSMALKKSMRRPADFLARYGGEEFVAILPDTDFKGAQIVSEMMRSNVEALKILHAFSKTSHCITISIGMTAAVPSENFSASLFLKKADDLLYQAKANGRNVAVVEELG